MTHTVTAITSKPRGARHPMKLSHAMGPAVRQFTPHAARGTPGQSVCAPTSGKTRCAGHGRDATG